MNKSFSKSLVFEKLHARCAQNPLRQLNRGESEYQAGLRTPCVLLGLVCIAHSQDRRIVATPERVVVNRDEVFQPNATWTRLNRRPRISVGLPRFHYKSNIFITLTECPTQQHRTPTDQISTFSYNHFSRLPTVQLSVKSLGVMYFEIK